MMPWRGQRLAQIAGPLARGGIKYRPGQSRFGEQARPDHPCRRGRWSRRQTRGLAAAAPCGRRRRKTLRPQEVARCRDVPRNARRALVLVRINAGKPGRIGQAGRAASRSAAAVRPPARSPARWSLPAVSLASGSGRVTSMRTMAKAYAGNSLRKSEPALSRRIWPSSWPSFSGVDAGPESAPEISILAVRRQDFAREA